MVRLFRMPGADMAEGIDDTLVRQNAIGGDEFLENKIDFAHDGVPPCVRAAILERLSMFASARCVRTTHSGSASRDLNADLRYGITLPSRIRGLFACSDVFH
jgi:hypothetical protein